MSSPSRGRTAVTRGANAHNLASASRLAHGTASLAERPSFPSVEVTRAFLEAFMCPFCELGPFKLVLKHISGTHGISAKEMRNYLQVPASRSFSDPSVRHALSERMKARPNLTREAIASGAKVSAEARAGREIDFETEERRAASQRFIGISTEKRSLRRAQMIDAWRDGAGTYDDVRRIAAEFGIARPGHLASELRRHGEDVPMAVS